MDTVDERLDWPDTLINKRLIAFIGSIVLLDVFYQGFGRRSVPAFVAYVVIMLLYLSMIWIRRVRWNTSKYAIACAIICSIAIYFHYIAQLNTAFLLWPLVAMVASLPQAKLMASVTLAAVCVGVTVVLSLPHLFPWGTILGMSGMYTLIRGRRIRREAQHLRALHLQELRQAHQELQHAHAELEQSSVQSIRYAALAERARIARDIHDVVGHNLTTLIVQLQALQYMLPNDPDGVAELVPKMLDVARTGMNEVRSAVGDWAEDDTGLGVVALRGLVSLVESRAALKIEFMAEDMVSEWPMNISVVLYRALQECLTNVLRYANASSVRVRIQETNDQLQIVVADDGCYEGNPPIQPGFGIHSMVERCSSVGGTCTFDINPPHGLTVNVSVPLSTTQSEADAICMNRLPNARRRFCS